MLYEVITIFDIQQNSPMMKSICSILILMSMVACNQTAHTGDDISGNPFFNRLNEPIQYADVSSEHITQYAEVTLKQIDHVLEGIRDVKSPDFENVFVAFDNVIRNNFV